jgi:hypothetical protein
MIEKPPTSPTFDPPKYARKTCKTCGGSGTFRVHVAVSADKKVVPKNNNTMIKACGCATKRYLQVVRGY